MVVQFNVFDFNVFDRPANEPVPWAHTLRDDTQGIYFYVEPSFALKKFKKDWTAGHEISHLVIPYLEEKDTWFAEGFASYFQYQVMYAGGNISWHSAMLRYRERIQTGKRMAQRTQQSLPVASLSMSYTGNSTQVYWGGTAYFLNVDYQLFRQKNMRLSQVLARYQACCRKNDDTLDGLIKALDNIVGTPIFRQTLNQQVLNNSYYPEYKRPLKWLASHPPKLIE